MKLPAEGIEYGTWNLTADFALDGDLEVFISSNPDFPAEDADWVSADWISAEVVTGEVHTRSILVLLAGSEVDSPPAGAHQLALGQNYAYIKLDDSPEIIIRFAGKIEGL